MPKFEPNGLIDGLSGRCRDRVYFMRGHKCFYKSHFPHPHDPKTYRQRRMRSAFARLTRLWTTLTPWQQTVWDYHARIHKAASDGHGYFLKLNLRLAGASLSHPITILQPNYSSASPDDITGFRVRALSSTQTLITFTNPNDPDVYVTAHYRLHPQFARKRVRSSGYPKPGCGPHPRFIATRRSDHNPIIHKHTWPKGCRLYYKLQSIDKSGRQSRFTGEIMIKVP